MGSQLVELKQRRGGSWSFLPSPSSLLQFQVPWRPTLALCHLSDLVHSLPLTRVLPNVRSILSRET